MREVLAQHKAVELKWVRSHRSEADVLEGVITREDRLGNDWADAAAKLGAGVHMIPEGVLSIFQATGCRCCLAEVLGLGPHCRGH